MKKSLLTAALVSVIGLVQAQTQEPTKKNDGNKAPAAAPAAATKETAPKPAEVPKAKAGEPVPYSKHPVTKSKGSSSGKTTGENPKNSSDVKKSTDQGQKAPATDPH